MRRDLLDRSLPPEVRERLDLTGTGLVVSVSMPKNGTSAIVEARRSTLPEVRKAEDGTVSLVGYAATWGVPYDVAGGAPYGWTETIAAGAVTKSLQERDDVRFLVNHEGVPLARTKSGTMRLASDDLGLLVDVLSLDMVNPTAIEIVSAMTRRDVDQMSWAFRVTRQEWNEDYTERTILEAQMFDVSAVTFPANPATIIGVRSDDPAPRRRMSLACARAIASTL